MNWLEELLKELKGWEKEGPEPEDPVADNEKVIGEVPVELRLLRGYSDSLKERVRQIHSSCLILEDEFDEDSILMELSDIKEKIDILHSLFWGCLRRSFTTKLTNIGVREGWKVVELPEEESPSVVVRSIMIPLFG